MSAAPLSLNKLASTLDRVARESSLPRNVGPTDLPDGCGADVGRLLRESLRELNALLSCCRVASFDRVTGRMRLEAKAPRQMKKPASLPSPEKLVREILGDPRIARVEIVGVSADRRFVARATPTVDEARRRVEARDPAARSRPDFADEIGRETTAPVAYSYGKTIAEALSALAAQLKGAAP